MNRGHGQGTRGQVIGIWNMKTENRDREQAQGTLTRKRRTWNMDMGKREQGDREQEYR